MNQGTKSFSTANLSTKDIKLWITGDEPDKSDVAAQDTVDFR
jgi:hypothetical protein